MAELGGNSNSEIPIERGFPIEQVNDLADREGRAKQHYRPLTTMHKWWARQLGCVFRTIALYSLIREAEDVDVFEPVSDGVSLANFDEATDARVSSADIAQMLDALDLSNPDSLWELYSKDVRVNDVKVLDPFMGGGTTLLETIRFGAEVTGVDLNPVAWFITKKELEAYQTDPDQLQQAFERVEAAVADELRSLYQTQCPNDSSHTADIMYAFWVRELDCTSCGETIPLFKDYRIASGRYDDEDLDYVYCPDCGELFKTDDYTTDSTCTGCGFEFVPSNGPVSRGGNYGCPSCGLKYPIVDAIKDGQSYAESLYAIEYYCTECDDEGHDRSTFKGFKSPDTADIERFEQASQTWEENTELQSYAPDGAIPKGAITAASSISGNDVFQHGYEDWQDMFNQRQLLAISTLLRAIDEVQHQSLKEYLLLAFSDALRFQNNFAPYFAAGGKVEGIFRRNSYAPQTTFAENNVWGTRAGRGTFSNTWAKIRTAVEYAHNPTERYLQDGTVIETEPFGKPVGGVFELLQGDMREVELDEEYDAIITDPPFYSNVIYSELSDFFYVWQRKVLSDEYEQFSTETTPRQESIIENPTINKSTHEYETELRQAFSRMGSLLKSDGVLVFTYRHRGIESWAALIDALCGEGFDIRALYPISANINEFTLGSQLNFSVIVVARPADGREPVSWSSLRRTLHKTARQTREQVKQGQTISDGDISVVEMGRCFREYSPHHGKVHAEGGVMSSAEIVEKITQLITDAITIDEIYLDLLALDDPTMDDVNRLCRGTDVSPDELAERHLIRFDGDFALLDWSSRDRIDYLQGRGDSELSPLDRVHLLRYLHERPPRPNTDSSALDVTGDMLDIAGELATVTGDEEYRAAVQD